MFFSGDNDDYNRRSWPHYNLYMGACIHCKQQFGGPKRENTCFVCHNERAEATIQRQQETDRSWAEAKAMFEEQNDER